MRVRLALVALFAPSPLFAQGPLPPQKPLPPVTQPGEPQKLPPTVAPMQPVAPGEFGTLADPTVRLPLKEEFRKLDASALGLRRSVDGWQLWHGGALFREFGQDRAAAEDARRGLADLRPTEWAAIGTGRPIVEYGLTNGKPAMWAVTAKTALAVDIKSVRAEQVRGTWVVCDDNAILLNFGAGRTDAEQAAAVARKYGFNRLALVGPPQMPTMTYFYAAQVPANAGNPVQAGALARVAQEQSLTRTGIPVPGLGFVGEQVKIDPRKVEVRKDRGEYVLAHGHDVLAKFGANDWTAREAQKLIQDGRFTEFGRVGSADIAFFFVNGAAPTKVPFMAQGLRFSPATLKARPTDARWGIFEGGGRMVFTAATPEEAEQLIKLVQAYQFDQVCQVGLSSRTSLRFLAKTAGR